MPWVKRIDNKITGEYESRADLMASFPLRPGEIAVEVESINEYKKEINAWIVSAKEKKPIKIKKAWSYEDLSDRAKEAIQKAIKEDSEECWMDCLGLFISEKWGPEKFCCKGNIPVLKEKVQKMINDASR